mgnify:CR=1 FL=1
MNRFTDLFKELKPEEGSLVSLSDKEERLTRTVRLLPVVAFLERIDRLAVI